MIFCKNPNSDVPILEIYEEIGETVDGGGFRSGINGKEFADYLKFIESQEGKKRVDIYINSVGGSIIDGLTIYNAIKSCTIPVNTICVGVAVSMAGIILQAGKKRQITKSGLFMMHDPSGGDAKELEKLKGTLVTILCEKTGSTAEEMSGFMSDTTWYDCFECLEKKIVDEIVDITHAANMPDNIKEETPQAAYLYLKNIVNKIEIKDINQPVKTIKMSKAKNALNLDETATDEEMVGSIKKLKNASETFLKAIKNSKSALYKILDKAEEDEDDEDCPGNLKKATKEMKDAFKKMNDDMEDLKKENDKLKEENKDLKNVKNEIEGAGLKAEAEIKVQDAIDKGKIKDTVKQKWVDLYIADKEETMELLNAINGTRGAGKMNIVDSKLPDSKKAGSVSNQVEAGLGGFLKARRQQITKEHEESHKRK